MVLSSDSITLLTQAGAMVPAGSAVRKTGRYKKETGHSCVAAVQTGHYGAAPLNTGCCLQAKRCVPALELQVFLYRRS